MIADFTAYCEPVANSSGLMPQWGLLNFVADQCAAIFPRFIYLRLCQTEVNRSIEEGDRNRRRSEQRPGGARGNPRANLVASRRVRQSTTSPACRNSKRDSRSRNIRRGGRIGIVRGGCAGFQAWRVSPVQIRRQPAWALVEPTEDKSLLC